MLMLQIVELSPGNMNGIVRSVINFIVLGPLLSLKFRYTVVVVGMIHISILSFLTDSRLLNTPAPFFVIVFFPFLSNIFLYLVSVMITSESYLPNLIICLISSFIIVLSLLTSTTFDYNFWLVACYQAQDKTFLTSFILLFSIYVFSLHFNFHFIWFLHSSISFLLFEPFLDPFLLSIKDCGFFNQI